MQASDPKVCLIVPREWTDPFAFIDFDTANELSNYLMTLSYYELQRTLNNREHIEVNVNDIYDEWDSMGLYVCTAMDFLYGYLGSTERRDNIHILLYALICLRLAIDSQSDNTDIISRYTIYEETNRLFDKSTIDRTEADVLRYLDYNTLYYPSVGAFIEQNQTCLDTISGRVLSYSKPLSPNQYRRLLEVFTYLAYHQSFSTYSPKERAEAAILYAVSANCGELIGKVEPSLELMCRTFHRDIVSSTSYRYFKSRDERN